MHGCFAIAGESFQLRGKRAGREAAVALAEVAVDIAAAQYEARFRDSMQAHHDLGA